MGFYGPEPCSTARATYVWTGLDEPGHFFVEVEGEAPNYTTGIQLVRDPHFVGGLKVDVMGWTGPVGQGTTPYHVAGTFPGAFLPKIVVQCADCTKVVEVRQIPADQAEEHLRERAGLASSHS
jgi:hypothetical protein